MGLRATEYAAFCRAQGSPLEFLRLPKEALGCARMEVGTSALLAGRRLRKG